MLAENGWQDFSSPSHWTTWQGGEMEPTIEARFRAFHTKDTLQIQVLVRDNNLCLFDTPEKAMNGDSVHLILQQRNPDGTVKQRAATVNVVAVQCDGKPLLVWRAWNAIKTIFYEKSRLHFQDLGNDWYLYTINLDAAEMSLDLSPGSMIGASVTVNNHSGFARDGFLSWGGGSDARLFNCLKIE
ncbi:hypothetical protein Ga0100231_015000 [Opitutaceae bacterium TAV4]|nr:hypothetical protein Ga0100231_015000 [Opitutaceae bacterium TAV4]